MLASIACCWPWRRLRKRRTRTTPILAALAGTVTDPDEKPVTGAVVQLKDMRTLQVRSFISQEDGSYHFSGLKVDNDYQVKADHNDRTSGWKTLSVFDARKEPVMNLKLEKSEVRLGPIFFLLRPVSLDRTPVEHPPPTLILEHVTRH